METKEPKPMETVDLNNVEIFSTGTWEGGGTSKGGDKITEATLDSWVDTFNKVGNKVKPRMILGHDASRSKGIVGMSSLGWVTGLKRSGQKLIADIKSVPKKIAQLIDKKALGRFSPGVYGSMNINGETHKNVVEHLALLGAQLPANMDIDGMIDLYYETEFEKEELKIYETKKEVKEMPDEIKTYEAELKAAEEKLKAYEKQEERIEAAEARAVEAQDLLESRELEHLNSEVSAYLDGQLKEGKISPAQVKHYTALALDKSVKEYSFIEDDKTQKVDGTGFELVKSIIENNEVMFAQGETSVGEPVDKTNLETIPDDDARVQKYMKDNNLESTPENYNTAYIAIGQEE